MAACAATEREVTGDNCCCTCVGCVRECLVACWGFCKLCYEDVDYDDPDADEPRNSPSLLEAAELNTQSQTVQVLPEPIPVDVIPATPVATPELIRAHSNQ